jgi:K+/H+ antiporter YhaU regulatory subunit KhtT
VSLKEFDFRAKTGATVVAIIRGDETISPPDVDDPLQNGDTLVVVGDAECLTAVRSIAGLSAA